MEYFDKEVLETKRALERQKYTTFGTGIYAGEELINFINVTIPDTKCSMWLPKSFVPMPNEVKKLKYPSANAPKYIITSLDTSVNIGFSFLPIPLADGELKSLRQQFQTAITNVNPAIKIQNQKDEKTGQEYDLSWFDFCGYSVDGQSYNRTCLIRLKNNVFHGIFNCFMKDKDHWLEIAGKIFKSLEEE